MTWPEDYLYLRDAARLLSVFLAVWLVAFGVILEAELLGEAIRRRRRQRRRRK